MALIVLAIMALVIASTPAHAQQPVTDERVFVAANIDFRNAYMFRGVRQDDEGLITWPSAEAGLRLRSAGSGLTSVRVSAGTWNSLHSGFAGSDGPSGKRWYESDTHATLSLGFDNAATLNTTFTAYRSPNDMFTTVKELSVAAVVDRPLSGFSLTPYALAAFELDTQPGIGQLDGGCKAGRYLELGATPAHTAGRLTLAAPVKVGLSLGNYYELAGKDRKFGYASVAGIVTVPLGGTANSNGWNLHGGVEYELLGDMAKAINNGDGSKTIGSVGVGFSY